MLRQARVSDAPEMHALISKYAERGLMLPRPLARLYESVRDFAVEEEDGRIVGAGALRTIWEDWGEICSLAVAEDRRRKGIGTSIVENLTEQAKLLGLGRVFVLTYIPDFFKRLGFEDIAKGELPHKVWADCVSCPKFPDCGEVALVRSL